MPKVYLPSSTEREKERAPEVPRKPCHTLHTHTPRNNIFEKEGPPTSHACMRECRHGGWSNKGSMTVFCPDQGQVSTSTKDGNPKYFSCCLMTYAPNLDLISSLISLEVLLLKKSDVLARLSCWPEALLKTYNTRCKASDYHQQKKDKIILAPLANRYTPQLSIINCRLYQSW